MVSDTVHQDVRRAAERVYLSASARFAHGASIDPAPPAYSPRVRGFARLARNTPCKPITATSCLHAMGGPVMLSRSFGSYGASRGGSGVCLRLPRCWHGERTCLRRGRLLSS